jgi:thiamine pyrophosphate-dependent acetolactate synthase large subunit-like protein
MNLNSLATIGMHQPKNLLHICWDNRCYEASGGSPTASAAERLDFASVARASGIESSWYAGIAAQSMGKSRGGDASGLNHA